MRALMIVAGTGIATVIIAMLMVLVYIAGASEQECTPGSKTAQELYCGAKGCQGDNGLVGQTP